MILERDIIKQAMYDAGMDEEGLRPSYSGRGMMGATCLGIVADGDDMLIKFVIAIVRNADQDGNGPHDWESWLPDVRKDNMGLSTIWYWPGVQVGEEE